MTYRMVTIPWGEKTALGFGALGQPSLCDDKIHLLIRRSVLLIAFQHSAKAK